jgi:hypothetical protein
LKASFSGMNRGRSPGQARKERKASWRWRTKGPYSSTRSAT